MRVVRNALTASKEISHDEALVNATITETNRLIQEGVTPLREDRERLKSQLKEVRSKAVRLMDALESGKVPIDRIEDRLKALETEDKDLKGQLETVGFELQSRENDSISAELVRQTYNNFRLVFDNLTAIDRK